jgi:hypothetical protein
MKKEFDFYDDILVPFTKKLPCFKWLVKGGVFGWAWWYALSHPWKIGGEVWDRIVYAYQRVMKGYDKPATYGSCHHFAEQIPAIIKELKAWGNSCPCGDSFLGSHAVMDGEIVTEEHAGFKKWHEILDEIIAGFEAAQRLLGHESPVWSELHNEWEKRFPEVEPHYFDYENATETGIPWETLPEYDALIKEINLWERDKQWRNDQLKVFHRGMLLFHQHFFELWD